MSDRKYYVLCEQNCKFESMTKEQILTAIAQAVESGEVKDVDTGFVQTVKTINGKGLRFFVGGQAEYELLTEEEKQDVFAIITNDTTKASLMSAIGMLEEVLEGRREVPSATMAEMLRCGAPVLNSAKKLTGGAGYYHIQYKFSATGMLDAGIIYWDGKSVTESSANYITFLRDTNNPALYFVHIDENGTLCVWGKEPGSGTADFTSNATIYTIKIGE